MTRAGLASLVRGAGLALVLAAAAPGLALAADGVAAGGVAAGGAAASDDAVSDDAVIAADQHQIRAVLADYGQLAAMNSDVIDYRVEADAPCQLVHITTRGVTSPIRYTLRRCPTDSGWKETLISGDDLVEAIEVEWQVQPEGEQTRVRLSILARIAKVPQFLVDQQTRRSVARTLKNLASKLDPSKH